MKVCTKCNIESNNFGNKSSWCRPCKAEYGRIKRGNPKRFRKKDGNLLECLDCSNYLSEDYFNLSERGSFGRAPYCKVCQKERDYPSKKNNGLAVKKYRSKGTYRANHRVKEFERRSKKNATSDGTVTNQFILSLLETGICTYCKESVKESDRTLDHIVPLSKGGTHSSQNLTMACLSCNCKKKDLSLEEFLNKYELSM